MLEILRNTPVVKKLILEGKVDTFLQALGNRESAMQLFDQHLCELYEAKVIRGTEAMSLARRSALPWVVSRPPEAAS